MKKITKKYTFTFGKYKGKSIKEILKEEGVHDLLSYIYWCKENVEWFKIKKKIIKDLKANSEPYSYSYSYYESNDNRDYDCDCDARERYSQERSADPNAGMLYSDELRELRDLENDSWYH